MATKAAAVTTTMTTYY